MNHKFRYINRNLKRKRRNSAIEINSWIYVTLASDTTYSMDWMPPHVCGTAPIFIGKALHRAIKIKEENDLTI